MSFRVSRTIRFFSAHRLHNTQLSDAENAELYQAGNKVNGHGHNYRLEVVVEGEKDPHTQFVMDLNLLTSILKTKVKAVYNRSSIDKDVPYYTTPGMVASTENVCEHVASLVIPELPKNVTLYKVKCWETDNNYVEYYPDYNDIQPTN